MTLCIGLWVAFHNRLHAQTCYWTGIRVDVTQELCSWVTQDTGVPKQRTGALTLVGLQMLRRAFQYNWRLWTIPELRETLLAAGFHSVHAWLRPMKASHLMLSVAMNEAVAEHA